MSSWLEWYPWGLSVVSLVCVYCLSNHRVVLGRYIGVLSAIGWGSYGYLNDQIFFIFTHVIFATIYINAILKFNQKRDAYRNLSAEQQQEIETLRQALDEKHAKRSKMLASHEKRLHKLAVAIQAQAKSNAHAANEMVKLLQQDHSAASVSAPVILPLSDETQQRLKKEA